MPDPIIETLGGLWAAFIVYRLETLRANHQALLERLMDLESKLRHDQE